MTKMKAVAASNFGTPDNVLSVVDDMEKPEPNEKSILIKVHACSLTPGDYRGLLGDKKVVVNPKQWPYIPGGDVCGTVVHVPKAFSNEFQVGDKVVSTWDVFGTGGLAQYHNVNPKFTVKLPKGLTAVQGSALANSSSHALAVLARAKVKEGDRILVLGGSGGIGTLLVQMLRSKKVSYIAATSTDTQLMKSLGVDRTVDYTKENFWEVKEFMDKKFDCIIDLAVGVEAWKKCKPVIKGCHQGGRFVAVVGQNWHLHCDSFGEVFSTVLIPPIKRQLFNMFRWKTPYYKMYLGGATKESMTEMLQRAADKDFKLVIDPKSPHPFTTQGVRDAWNHHIARKGHGKIVISLEGAKEEATEEEYAS